jgi:hypothetical protein
MPPSQIFVSTRSRREYPRRRATAPIMPVSVLLAVVLFVWVLTAAVLWWGVL